MKIGLILLAGGKGTRMGLEKPKQFLPLGEKAVLSHSLELFEEMGVFSQIVIVIDPEFQSLYPGRSYALPGKRRQDSVFNGFLSLDPSIELVCIHDGARPLLTADLVLNVLAQAKDNGAAALAVPLKFTVKQADEKGKVKCTLDRSLLWEMQTPQVVRKDLLEKGFKRAESENLTVTDDVSLVELFDHPVELVMGSYHNLKLTTQDDFLLAEMFLRNHR